jgi:hypothetical protein
MMYLYEDRRRRKRGRTRRYPHDHGGAIGAGDNQVQR